MSPDIPLQVPMMQEAPSAVLVAPVVSAAIGYANRPLLLRQQLPAPHPALRASIIIPAKNEAENLIATLTALAAQTDLTGQPLAPETFEIIVLANNCTDNTAAVGRSFARQHPNLKLHMATLRLPKPEAHIGRARRLLMDEACHRLLAVGRPTGLIASTDADTRVAPTWLAATLAEIKAGADAVGGRIFTETPSPQSIGAAPSIAACPLRRTQLRDAAYHLLCTRLEAQLDPQPADPWPRHHQHFGASLALTARAYQHVGGLPEVRFLEDEALCRLLRRHDLRLRHSPCVVVRTSARQVGRVEVGLSWQLREWAALNAEQREPLVDCPAQLAALWQARRQLRRWWQGTETWGSNHAALATALQVPAKALAAQVRASLTFGRLWEWVLSTQAASGWQLAQVPVSMALVQLRALLPSAAQIGQAATSFPAHPAGTALGAAHRGA